MSVNDMRKTLKAETFDQKSYISKACLAVYEKFKDVPEDWRKAIFEAQPGTHNKLMEHFDLTQIREKIRDRTIIFQFKVMYNMRIFQDPDIAQLYFPTVVATKASSPDPMSKTLEPPVTTTMLSTSSLSITSIPSMSSSAISHSEPQDKKNDLEKHKKLLEDYCTEKRQALHISLNQSGPFKTLVDEDIDRNFPKQVHYEILNQIRQCLLNACIVFRKIYFPDLADNALDKQSSVKLFLTIIQCRITALQRGTISGTPMFYGNLEDISKLPLLDLLENCQESAAVSSTHQIPDRFLESAYIAHLLKDNVIERQLLELHKMAVTFLGNLEAQRIEQFKSLASLYSSFVASMHQLKESEFLSDSQKHQIQEETATASSSDRQGLVDDQKVPQELASGVKFSQHYISTRTKTDFSIELVRERSQMEVTHDNKDIWMDGKCKII